MQIYDKEIIDNLQGSLLNNKVVCECTLKECINLSPLLTEDIKRVVAFANPNQPDLYYLEAILVSLGWNKNDDVFDKKHLLDAVTTPIHKPFNFMHESETVIGHITDSYLLDVDGNTIDRTQAEKSDLFDIGISSVLYKLLEVGDKTISEIIQEIESGKWKVSMECVFNGFDYALITPKGENRVLARDKDSSFLTKHLKVYGGDGVYDGYRIGRLLKNFYFSAVGLVNNPANPRSIIRIPFDGTQANLQEIYMAVTQEDFDKVVAEKTILVESSAKAQQALTQAQTDIKALQETIATLTKTVETVQAECETMKKEKEEMKKGLEAEKSKTKSMERRNSLAKHVSAEEADRLVNEFSQASDEIFDKLVDVFASTKTNKTEAKEEEVTLAKDTTQASLVDGGHQTQNKFDMDKAVASVVEFLKANKEKK